MRVLRITPLWDWRAHPGPLPLTNAAESVGGHATQAVRIAIATAAHGVEQDVIAPRAAGGPARHDLAPGIAVRGVGPAGVPEVHRRNLAWLAGVVAELRRRRTGYDVVHLHASGIVEPLWAAVAAATAVDAPLVLTLHHSAQVTYVPVSRRDAAVQVVTRAAERAAMRRAAVTLTLSRRVADRLAAVGPAEALGDLVDADAIRDAATPEAGNAFRGRLGIPAGAVLAAYVGRVSEEKGWRDLPPLVAAIDGLHVAVCGDGPGLAELRALAPDRLHAVGALAAPEVAAALAAADVLVLPSRIEELGSVLLEAAAAGTPSVAYDVGGVSEALEDGVTGLLVAGTDPASLTAAVQRVLTDAALRERAATEGPRLVRERFDHAVLGARLADVYAEVARAWS